jgi:hypothetical protein
MLFLSFEPSMRHKMQPLDTAVYGPLTLWFEQATCIKKKSVQIVNQCDVANYFHLHI